MIILPAEIESISTRKDNSLKIIVGTQELTPEKAGTLFHLMKKLAYVAIKEESFSQEELDVVEELNAEEMFDNKKTPSKRLRSCLYVLFTKHSDGFSSFKDFYDNRMEKLILKVKDEIEQFN